MKSDNSLYTVTPPDLYLSENGLNVLVTSTNPVFVQDVQAILEHHIAGSIVFNLQEHETNSSSLPWFWHVSRTCEYMIVDLDTCAWEDILAAILKRRDNNHIVIFYSAKGKRREAIKLINATSRYTIFNSIEELNEFLEVEFKLRAESTGFFND